MVTYTIIKENNYSNELGNYISYGIKADDGKNPITINDVFLDEHEATYCIDLFNREQLDTVHLEQVLDEIMRYGI